MIHEQIAEQARQRPHAAALAFQDCHVTYHTLHTQSNRLARYLRKKGIGPGVHVGVYMERSPDVWLTLLAVLKAGGAYVPLDPAWPADRLAFMMEDSGAPIIVTDSGATTRLSGMGRDCIMLGDEEHAIARESADDLPPVDLKDCPAYLMYTSGSTGKPKGIMISHYSLTQFISVARLRYGVKSDDRMLQFHSFGFDPSLEEAFTCLTSGATLVLRTPAMMGSVQEFLKICDEMAITVLDLPTAYWNEMVSGLNDNVSFPESLRLVIIGGEAAKPDRLSLWQRKAPRSVRLMNTYGPTETTIVVTACDLNEPLRERVSIGWPLSHCRLYVMNEDLDAVASDTSGEILIGGEGVGIGYWGQPRRTAESFVPDPYSDRPGMRLYRTGDQGSVNSEDGCFHYEGRLDHQVKISGYRIELEEIEIVLRQHPAVTDAVVAAVRNDREDISLKGYVISEKGVDLVLSSLRQDLQRKLPPMMIPETLEVRERFPLTPNGKIDRTELTQSGDRAERKEEERVAPPVTEVERALAKIWQEVLGSDPVGVDENFFERGGHSLTAIQLASRVRADFGVELPLATLFEAATIKEWSKIIEQAGEPSDKTALIPLQPLQRQAYEPLSFSQERLWFVTELEPDNVAYHFAMTIRFQGQMTVKTLNSALTEIVRRHEILRTTFVMREDQPTQRVYPPFSVKVAEVDLSHHPAEIRQKKLEKLIWQESRRPFDVGQLPLIRWILVRMRADKHQLVQVEHHFVHDGWSLYRMIEELQALYTAYACGKPSPLSEPLVQYADYARWQREWINGQEARQQLAYWKSLLAGEVTPLQLPTDRPRPAVQTFSGSLKKATLSPRLYRNLVALSRQQQVTLFMTMLAAFKALLYRYTGQNVIQIGTSVANRRSKEMESLIGMIVNNIVLRTECKENPVFLDFLKSVRNVAMEAFHHQDVPFEKVVEVVRPNRDLSQNPLFPGMFSFHDAPVPDIKLPGLTGEITYLHNKSAKFDFNVIVVPPGRRADPTRECMIEWEYNSDLYDDQTIERMLKQYIDILEAVTEHPTMRLSELPLLSEEERQQQVVIWNDTEVSHTGPAYVHEWIAQQAAQTPDAVALSRNEQQWTYRQLDRSANRVAQALRDQGVGPDTRVGICIRRSFEMLVGILGTLKAGGAYVPLDPAYPSERLSYIMEDCQGSLILTERDLLENLSGFTGPILCLDDERERQVPLNPVLTDFSLAPENLAYVMYTSGSTGKPKGVMVSHRGLTNYLMHAVQVYGLATGARVPVHTSFAFDLTVTSLLAPLASGGRLELMAEEEEWEQLAEGLNQQAFALVKMTPAHLQVINRMLEEPAVAGNGALVVGGEALYSQDWAHWQSAGSGMRLINEYGPTETVVGCSFYEWKGEEAGAVPIGRPIANTKLYVLDRNLELLPTGVEGELFVSGAGVARGYWLRPGQTAASFVPNPFTAIPGDRMYRTGDRVCYRDDGNLEYRGRLDSQVKVRGYRIEPEEIEQVVSGHPAVAECAVIARRDGTGSEKLVAYIVTKEGSTLPDLADLRQNLSRQLPAYMVPAEFITLAELPLTPNGKVDRRALPASGDQPLPSGRVQPRNEIERELVHIWQEILGVEVGVKDDFFTVGGHSIAAVRVISRIHRRFQVKPSLRTLFEQRTVAALAEWLSQRPHDGVSNAKVGSVNHLSDEEVTAQLRRLLEEVVDE
jgi:amino acid adenylation domain-containing protein